jgi:hypothetical protein
MMIPGMIGIISQMTISAGADVSDAASPPMLHALAYQMPAAKRSTIVGMDI